MEANPAVAPPEEAPRLELRDFVVCLNAESVDDLCAGLKRARAQFIAERRSDSAGGQPLLQQYLEASPEASELFGIWAGLKAGATSRVACMIVDVLAVVVSLAPREAAAAIAKKALTAHGRALSSNLLCDSPRQIRVTLKLLTSAVRLSGPMAREVWRRMPLTPKALELISGRRAADSLGVGASGHTDRHAADAPLAAPGAKGQRGLPLALILRRKRADKVRSKDVSSVAAGSSASLAKHVYIHGHADDDVRANFVRLACALLSAGGAGAPDVVAEVVKGRGVVAALLRGLAADAGAVAVEALVALADAFLVPASAEGALPARLLVETFQPHALVLLLGCYARREEPLLRRALHAFLVALLTGQLLLLAAPGGAGEEGDEAPAAAGGEPGSGSGGAVRRRRAAGTTLGGALLLAAAPAVEALESWAAVRGPAAPLRCEGEAAASAGPPPPRSLPLLAEGPAAAAAAAELGLPASIPCVFASLRRGAEAGQGGGGGRASSQPQPTAADDTAAAGGAGAGLSWGDDEEGSGDAGLLDAAAATERLVAALDAGAGPAASSAAGGRGGASSSAAGAAHGSGSSVGLLADRLGVQPAVAAALQFLAAVKEPGDPLQGDLVLRLLRSAPLLQSLYLTLFPHALDARPSSRWLANCALAGEVLRCPLERALALALQRGAAPVTLTLGLTCGSGLRGCSLGEDAWLAASASGGDGPGAAVVAAVVPHGLSRAVLTRGLLHVHPVVALHSLGLLCAVLCRARAALLAVCEEVLVAPVLEAGAAGEGGQAGAAPSDAVIAAAVAEATIRVKAQRAAAVARALAPSLPDVQTLVALRSRIAAWRRAGTSSAAAPAASDAVAMVVEGGSGSSAVVPPAPAPTAVYDLDLASPAAAGGKGAGPSASGSPPASACASVVPLPVVVTLLLHRLLCALRLYVEVLPSVAGVAGAAETDGSAGYGFDFLKLLVGETQAAPAGAGSPAPLLRLLLALPPPTPRDVTTRWLLQQARDSTGAAPRIAPLRALLQQQCPQVEGAGDTSPQAAAAAGFALWVATAQRVLLASIDGEARALPQQLVLLAAPASLHGPAPDTELRVFGAAPLSASRWPAPDAGSPPLAPAAFACGAACEAGVWLRCAAPSAASWGTGTEGMELLFDLFNCAAHGAVPSPSPVFDLGAGAAGQGAGAAAEAARQRRALLQLAPFTLRAWLALCGALAVAAEEAEVGDAGPGGSGQGSRHSSSAIGAALKQLTSAARPRAGPGAGEEAAEDGASVASRSTARTGVNVSASSARVGELACSPGGVALLCRATAGVLRRLPPTPRAALGELIGSLARPAGAVLRALHAAASPLEGDVPMGLRSPAQPYGAASGSAKKQRPQHPPPQSVGKKRRGGAGAEGASAAPAESRWSTAAGLIAALTPGAPPNDLLDDASYATAAASAAAAFVAVEACVAGPTPPTAAAARLALASWLRPLGDAALAAAFPAALMLSHCLAGAPDAGAAGGPFEGLIGALAARGSARGRTALLGMPLVARALGLGGEGEEAEEEEEAAILAAVGAVVPEGSAVAAACGLFPAPGGGAPPASAPKRRRKAALEGPDAGAAAAPPASGPPVHFSAALHSALNALMGAVPVGLLAAEACSPGAGGALAPPPLLLSGKLRRVLVGALQRQLCVVAASGGDAPSARQLHLCSGDPEARDAACSVAGLVAALLRPSPAMLGGAEGGPDRSGAGGGEGVAAAAELFSLLLRALQPGGLGVTAKQARGVPHAPSSTDDPCPWGSPSDSASLSLLLLRLLLREPAVSAVFAAAHAPLLLRDSPAAPAPASAALSACIGACHAAVEGAGSRPQMQELGRALQPVLLPSVTALSAAVGGGASGAGGGLEQAALLLAALSPPLLRLLLRRREAPLLAGLAARLAVLPPPSGSPAAAALGGLLALLVGPQLGLLGPAEAAGTPAPGAPTVALQLLGLLGSRPDALSEQHTSVVEAALTAQLRSSRRSGDSGSGGCDSVPAATGAVAGLLTKCLGSPATAPRCLLLAALGAALPHQVLSALQQPPVAATSGSGKDAPLPLVSVLVTRLTVAGTPEPSEAGAEAWGLLVAAESALAASRASGAPSTAPTAALAVSEALAAAEVVSALVAALLASEGAWAEAMGEPAPSAAPAARAALHSAAAALLTGSLGLGEGAVPLPNPPQKLAAARKAMLRSVSALLKAPSASASAAPGSPLPPLGRLAVLRLAALTALHTTGLPSPHGDGSPAFAPDVKGTMVRLAVRVLGAVLTEALQALRNLPLGPAPSASPAAYWSLARLALTLMRAAPVWAALAPAEETTAPLRAALAGFRAAALAAFPAARPAAASNGGGGGDAGSSDSDTDSDSDSNSSSSSEDVAVDGAAPAPALPAPRSAANLLSVPGVLVLLEAAEGVLEAPALRGWTAGAKAVAGGASVAAASAPLRPALLSHPSVLHLLLRDRYSAPPWMAGAAVAAELPPAADAETEDSPVQDDEPSVKDGARLAVARLLLRCSLAASAPGAGPAPELKRAASQLLPVVCAAYTASLSRCDRLLRRLIGALEAGGAAPEALGFAWSRAALPFVQWGLWETRSGAAGKPSAPSGAAAAAVAVAAVGAPAASQFAWLWAGEETTGTGALGGRTGGGGKSAPRPQGLRQPPPAQLLAPPPSPEAPGAALARQCTMGLAGGHLGLLPRRTAATLGDFPVYRSYSHPDAVVAGAGAAAAPLLAPRVRFSDTASEAALQAGAGAALGPSAASSSASDARETARASLYDPSWVLRALTAALVAGRVQTRRFVAGGALGFTLACLTSAHPEVRGAAYGVVGAYFALLVPAEEEGEAAAAQGQGAPGRVSGGRGGSRGGRGGMSAPRGGGNGGGGPRRPPAPPSSAPSSFPEQAQVALLLTLLRSSITVPFQRVPAAAAVFLGEAAEVVLRPAHPQYALVSRYLLRRRALDFGEPPMLFAALAAAGAAAASQAQGGKGAPTLPGGSQGALEWALRLATRGLQGAGDHAALRRRHAYHALLAAVGAALPPASLTDCGAGGILSPPPGAVPGVGLLRRVVALLLRAAGLHGPVLATDEEALRRHLLAASSFAAVAAAGSGAMALEGGEGAAGDSDDGSSSDDDDNDSSGSDSSSDAPVAAAHGKDWAPGPGKAGAAPRPLPACDGPAGAEPTIALAAAPRLRGRRGGAGRPAAAAASSAAGGEPAGLLLYGPICATYLRRGLGLLGWLAGLWARAAACLLLPGAGAGGPVRALLLRVGGEAPGPATAARALSSAVLAGLPLDVLLDGTGLLLGAWRAAAPGHAAAVRATLAAGGPPGELAPRLAVLRGDVAELESTALGVLSCCVTVVRALGAGATVLRDLGSGSADRHTAAAQHVLRAFVAPLALACSQMEAAGGELGAALEGARGGQEEAGGGNSASAAGATPSPPAGVSPVTGGRGGVAEWRVLVDSAEAAVQQAAQQ